MQVLIPAAGFGTRFLPYTLAVPKEMLPLLNKPAIHYCLKECVDANSADIIFITHPNKTSLLEYLKKNSTMHDMLVVRGYQNLLVERDKVLEQTSIKTVFQEEQHGLGHALLRASELIKKSEKYSGIVLPDDIVFHDEPALSQLKKISEEFECSVIGIVPVLKHQLSAYGVITVKREINTDLFEISDVVEKPSPENAPSHWAVIGRYIIDNELFDALSSEKIVPGKELGLTDGLQSLLKRGKKILAYHVKGVRHDIGTPDSWAQAIVWLTKNNIIKQQQADFSYSCNPCVNELVES